MVDGRLEEDRGRAVRVVGRKGEGELEGQAFVVRFRRPRDGGGPREQVTVAVGEGGDAGRGGHHELHELGLEPLCWQSMLVWRLQWWGIGRLVGKRFGTRPSGWGDGGRDVPFRDALVVRPS